MPRGSSGEGAQRSCPNVSSTTIAARAKAPSTSPWRWRRWNRTRPAARAASSVATAGSGSQSTAISSLASAATDALEATTAATASPQKRATPSASAGHAVAVNPPPSSRGASGFVTARSSSAVTTARTPGSAVAAAASIRPILACACGLRAKHAESILGSTRSSRYRARPVRSRGSSSRLTLVPV